MRWLASTIGAMSLLASVALPMALSDNSSPLRGANLPANGRACASTPDWFRAIHRAYDCNPNVTPHFDFASLYDVAPRQQGQSEARSGCSAHIRLAIGGRVCGTLGGVPAAQAAAWLGHSPVEHVRTYAHVVLDRREVDYDMLMRARAVAHPWHTAAEKVLISSMV